MYLPLAGVDKPWIGDIIIGAKAHGKNASEGRLSQKFPYCNYTEALRYHACPCYRARINYGINVVIGIKCTFPCLRADCDQNIKRLRCSALSKEFVTAIKL